MKEFSAEEMQTHAAGQPRGADAARPRAAPGMQEPGRGPPGLRRLALGQGREPPRVDLQRDQVRPARLRPRPARRPRAATGSGSRSSPRASSATPGCSPTRAPSRRRGSGPRRRSRSARRWCGRSSATGPRSPSRRCASGRIAHIGLAPRRSPPDRQGRTGRRRPPTSSHAGHDGANEELAGRGIEGHEQRFLRSTRHPRGRRRRATRSTASTRCSRSSTSPGFPTRSRSCSRTCCGSRTASRSPRDDVETIAKWDAKAEPSVEIPFQPARVLMQDFTGVPAVVDLAAMRDAMDEIGGDPAQINPLVDVDLVIDHSVQVDAFGNERAFAINAERDFERNRERYSFLKWGQESFDNFRVVPPATGICHQVNLEYIAQVVYRARARTDARRPIPTRSSAPTPTRRWSTGSACSAGASAGSRPRRRCSASRSRCCCRRSSASGSPASCPRARPRPTSS